MQKRETIHLMGTIIDLLIEHDSPEPILTEMIKRLKKYEQRFSANDDNSELMNINRNAGVQPVFVHPELYQLIKIGKFHSCAPDSNLNIAIGPLVQSWRIGFKDAKVPSAAEIEQLLNKTNPQNIVLNDQEMTVYLKEEGMVIDLGSLAKGYIADLIIQYLKSMGVTSALVNLGGNVVGLGPASYQEKDAWNIGIQNPMLTRNEFLATLKITNQSVVTSGIYERSLIKDNQVYHHIFDPRTGYPIETDVASLTIQSAQSLDGEIWTTRLFGKAAEEIIYILDGLEEIEGLVVTKGGRLLSSKGLEKLMLKK